MSSSDGYSSPLPKKMLTLVTSDDVKFEVDEAVARQSETLQRLMEGGCDEGVIPLANVESQTFERVLKFCKKHVKEDEGIAAWDLEFVEDFSYHVLFQLILAANYLHIQSLMDLCCLTVADMIKDKSVEQVRAIFNIENDFAPEEEAKLREEYQWAHN